MRADLTSAPRAHRAASALAIGADAAALPAELASRAFGAAWLIAVAAHFALLAVLTWGPSSPVDEEPPIRLVFVEPPPPPPAPLGVAGGTGTVQALPQPAPQQVQSVAEEARVAEPREPQQLARTSIKAKPKAKPKLEPAPAQAPPEREDLAPGTAAGATTGEVGGVVGGVTGGVVGGTVGGTGTGPVPVGQVAHRPTLVRRVSPTYPEDARRQEVEGLVLLEAVLDRDGAVEPEIKVLSSVPMLDGAAVAAVRQWRFRPARNESGTPLRVILEIPIRFVLR